MLQAVTESISPTKDHIIHFFAFVALASSHIESMYIIPEAVTAITEKTAT